MSRPLVYVTRSLPEEALQRLRERCEVTVNPHDRAATRQELLAGVAEADALLCLLTDEVDGEVLAAGPRLRVVSNFAVGYNNVDVAEATRRGIPVCNTPGVLTETSADLAFALVLATARRVVEADQFLRAGRFQGWGPLLLLGTDVHGKTLGIVGLGRIGQAVARRARGFAMRVVYHQRHRLKPGDERALGVSYRGLDDLLRESDYVSLHVPLTAQTRHLIGPRELSLMKSTAILINTARGPVVDEAALAAALAEGRIAGAGLDVYEEEPRVHPGLLALPQTVLLPHVASATRETRTRMALMAVENLLAVLEGRRPPHVVNPEVLDGRGQTGA